MKQHYYKFSYILILPFLAALFLPMNFMVCQHEMPDCHECCAKSQTQSILPFAEFVPQHNCCTTYPKAVVTSATLVQKTPDSFLGKYGPLSVETDVLFSDSFLVTRQTLFASLKANHFLPPLFLIKQSFLI